MDNLFITFHAFLLLFIFLAGGVNKIANFQGTADFLETKVNALELNPIFFAAVIIAILYFYVILISFGKLNQPNNIYLFLFISVVLVGIPTLSYTIQPSQELLDYLRLEVRSFCILFIRASMKSTRTLRRLG